MSNIAIRQYITIHSKAICNTVLTHIVASLIVTPFFSILHYGWMMELAVMESSLVMKCISPQWMVVGTQLYCISNISIFLSYCIAAMNIAIYQYIVILLHP